MVLVVGVQICEISLLTVVTIVVYNLIVVEKGVL